MYTLASALWNAFTLRYWSKCVFSANERNSKIKKKSPTLQYLRDLKNSKKKPYLRNPRAQIPEGANLFVNKWIFHTALWPIPIWIMLSNSYNEKQYLSRRVIIIYNWMNEGVQINFKNEKIKDFGTECFHSKEIYFQMLRPFLTWYIFDILC